jgi:hypothetical protein
MIDACRSTGRLKAVEKVELQELHKARDNDVIVEFCKQFLGQPEYENVIAGLFKPKRLPSKLPVHDQLATMKFSSIITTNYDLLIEASLRRLTKNILSFTNDDVSPLWKMLMNHEQFLFKLHGDVHKPRTMIFTYQEYKKHIHGNPEVLLFLKALLMSKSVLFVGTSMDDKYIRMLLEEIDFQTQSSGPQHYAIMPKIGPIQQKMYQDRFNISPIPYTPYGHNNHTTPIKKNLVSTNLTLTFCIFCQV